MESQLWYKLVKDQMPGDFPGLYDDEGGDLGNLNNNMSAHGPYMDGRNNISPSYYNENNNASMSFAGYYDVETPNELAGYHGYIEPRYVSNQNFDDMTLSQEPNVNMNIAAHRSSKKQSRQLQRSNGGNLSNSSKKSTPQGTRKRINPDQTSILEKSFQQIPRPGKELREELSNRTGLPVKNIQIWFQNRRAKAKAVNETSILKVMSQTASGQSHGDSKSHSQVTGSDGFGVPQKGGQVFVNTDIGMAYQPRYSDASWAALHAANVGTRIAPFMSQPPRGHLRHFSSDADEAQYMNSHGLYDGHHISDNRNNSHAFTQDLSKSSNIVSQVVQLPGHNYYKTEPDSSIRGLLSSPFTATPSTGLAQTVFEGMPSPSDESWSILIDSKLSSDELLLTPASTLNCSPTVSPFVASSPSTLRTPVCSSKEVSSASSSESLSTINTEDSSPRYFDPSLNLNLNYGRAVYGSSGGGIPPKTRTPVEKISNIIKQQGMKLDDLTLLSYPPSISAQESYGWSRNGIKSATESTFTGGVVASSPLRPVTPPVIPQNLRRSVSTSGIQRSGRKMTRLPCNEEMSGNSGPVSGRGSVMASPDYIAKSDNTIRGGHDSAGRSGERSNNRVSIVKEEDSYEDDNDDTLMFSSIGDLDGMDFLESSASSALNHRNSVNAT